MTWGSLLRDATQRLHDAGMPDARRAARWLLADVLACSPAHLLAYPERPATLAHAEALAAMVARRLRHEPLQYILGYAEFFGLRLRVTNAVLIPRPETEQVVEEALALLVGRAAPRILDVGTGSGCIALVLKRECPDAIVSACDLSSAALDVACVNAATHHLDVAFVQADALAPDFPNQVPGSFDLLVSNPPYIADAEAAELDPEVRDYEPAQALFAGSDPLLFYRALARHAARMLAPGGALVFETHAHHGHAVGAVLEEAGFADVHVKRDLAGHPRMVTAHQLAR